jgi:hypothetical protein
MDPFLIYNFMWMRFGSILNLPFLFVEGKKHFRNLDTGGSILEVSRGQEACC